jgi:tetratricopeptide (TPR) repeat protein
MIGLGDLEAMKQTLATSLGLIVMICAPAIAADAPPADQFLPLVDGRVLVYRTGQSTNGEAQPAQETRQQISRKTDAGKSVWIFDGFGMEPRDDGVYRVGIVGNDGRVEPLAEPYKFIGGAPRVGEKWSFKDGDATTAATVLGVEKVKVEAGEFDAVKLYFASTAGQGGETRRSQYTRWFAAGIGLVKETGESRATSRDGKTVTRQWTRELIERPRTGQRPGAVAGDAPRPAGRDDAVATLFSEGEALARKGDHRAAIEKYDAALAKDPNAAKLHAYRAISLMASKRYDEAQRSIESAVRLNDKEHTYHEIAGQLKIAQGRVDEGVTLYDRAASLAPRAAGNVYMDLAAVLSARNDTRLSPQIDRALKKAATADPPSLDALFTLGQSYINAGRTEGKDYLRRYVELATALPQGRRDETKIRLAKQLIRAIDAVKGP